MSTILSPPSKVRCRNCDYITEQHLLEWDEHPDPSAGVKYQWLCPNCGSRSNSFHDGFELGTVTYEAQFHPKNTTRDEPK